MSVSGPLIFYDYSKRPNFSFFQGSSRYSFRHKLMYFGLFYKKSPENWSMKVLKKDFSCRFQDLEFFSTTRNDQIFLFSRAPRVTHFGINLCIQVYYTRNHPTIAVWKSSKKVFYVGFRTSNFLRLLETTKFFFFQGSSRDSFRHKLMYFGLLHKKSPENCSMKVLKKSFLCRFQDLKFFFD